MDLGLGGRIAIVTGGGRGIGYAIVERLAREGATVIAVDKEFAEGWDANCPADIRHRISARVCDVTSDDEVAKFAAEIQKDSGDLHILVNAAGINRNAVLGLINFAACHEVFAVNLTGPLRMMNAFRNLLLGSDYGRVVNIGSVTGQKGGRGQAVYSMSKAGLANLTKTAAIEFARRNVTCNVVAPGLIDTMMTQEMTPAAKKKALEQILLKRIGLPVEVASAVAFLCSAEAAYITGQVLCVDGGMSLS